VSLGIKTLPCASRTSSANLVPKRRFLIANFWFNLKRPALVKSYLRRSNNNPFKYFEAPSAVAVSP